MAPTITTSNVIATNAISGTLIVANVDALAALYKSNKYSSRYS
jgi:hypothetical protein